jgi:cell division protein FtsB
LAKAQEQKVLEQMKAENASLQAQIKELEDAANEDPDADKPALNDAARMRIDSVH